MKKLEKLGSKLFEEFRGDAVSELASVVGGVVVNTSVKRGGCEEKDSETYGTTMRNGKEISYKCADDKTSNLDDVVFHSVFAGGGSGYVDFLPGNQEDFANTTSQLEGSGNLAVSFG